MTKDFKILVADDHPMLLKGFLQELTENGYKNIVSANNGLEALDLIIKEKPEIAILDIEMPVFTGFEVINKSKEISVNTKFIIHTSHKERAFILKAKKLNISGYLLKDEPFAEIENCIVAVFNGETYFSNTFDEIVSNSIEPKIKKVKLLSPSERTILRRIAHEKSTKEIAEELKISPRTVEKHRSNIIVKLDLDASQDALALWTKENIELLLSL